MNKSPIKPLIHILLKKIVSLGYTERVREYRGRAYLCKLHPDKCKMNWVGEYWYYYENHENTYSGNKIWSRYASSEPLPLGPCAPPL